MTRYGIKILFLLFFVVTSQFSSVSSSTFDSELADDADASYESGGFRPPRSSATPSASVNSDEKSAIWTAAGDMSIKVDASFRPELKVFCWAGLSKTFARIWYSASILLNITEDTFHLYKGETTQQVQDQFKSSTRWLALFPWRSRTVRLNPFSPTCVGIYTKEPYTVLLKVQSVDPYRIGAFVAGMILILFARKMSGNVVFHYSSGISVALLGSLLVAVFLISRLIPKKTVGATFLVGGWAVILYFLQTVWKNLREMLMEHMNYVIAYVVSVSIISFVLIYRFGGVHNPKTMNIIQWGLQLVGAVLVYLSCTIEYAGVGFAVGLLLIDFLSSNKNGFRYFTFLNRFFPPRPRKLLSEREYEEVGDRTTREELQKLRKFMSSPECNAWDLVQKLRTPEKVSKFVQEGIHLTPDEIDSHDRVAAFDDSDLDEDLADYPPNIAPSRTSGIFQNMSQRISAISSAAKAKSPKQKQSWPAFPNSFTDDEDDDRVGDLRARFSNFGANDDDDDDDEEMDLS